MCAPAKPGGKPEACRPDCPHNVGCHAVLAALAPEAPPPPPAPTKPTGDR